MSVGRKEALRYRRQGYPPRWQRCYPTGELALAMAGRDPEFKAWMLDGLDRRPTDPDDRALFGLPRKPPPGA